jgi:hypothetical protein
MNELKTAALTLSVQLTKIDSFNLPLDCKSFAFPSVWNGHLALLTNFKEGADNDEKHWIYQRTSPMISCRN